jgi:hypothetical protein
MELCPSWEASISTYRRILWGGVRLGPRGTAATIWPNAPAHNDECGAVSRMSGRGNRSTRRKPAPVPLCPPQILTWARSRAAVVGSRRLSAWAMARPPKEFPSILWNPKVLVRTMLWSQSSAMWIQSKTSQPVSLRSILIPYFIYVYIYAFAALSLFLAFPRKSHIQHSSSSYVPQVMPISTSWTSSS